MNGMKFPQIHIAESVINRILNANDEIAAARQITNEPTQVDMPPSIPDPSMEGAQLNLELQAETPPVAGESPDLMGGLLQGTDLIEGL